MCSERAEPTCRGLSTPRAKVSGPPLVSKMIRPALSYIMDSDILNKNIRSKLSKPTISQDTSFTPNPKTSLQPRTTLEPRLRIQGGPHEPWGSPKEVEIAIHKTNMSISIWYGSTQHSPWIPEPLALWKNIESNQNLSTELWEVKLMSCERGIPRWKKTTTSGKRPRANVDLPKTPGPRKTNNHYKARCVGKEF